MVDLSKIWNEEKENEDEIGKVYPMWYCPCWGCGYRTSYSRNVEKHLKKAHGFPRKKLRKELDRFFSESRILTHVSKQLRIRWDPEERERLRSRLHVGDRGVICDKGHDDPTRPPYMHYPDEGSD